MGNEPIPISVHWCINSFQYIRIFSGRLIMPFIISRYFPKCFRNLDMDAILVNLREAYDCILAISDCRLQNKIHNSVFNWIVYVEHQSSICNTYHLLLITYYLLLTTYYLLLITYYLSLTTYHLLLTRGSHLSVHSSSPVRAIAAAPPQGPPCRAFSGASALSRSHWATYLYSAKERLCCKNFRIWEVVSICNMGFV